MLAVALSVLISLQSSIAPMDAAAKKRDVNALLALSSPALKKTKNPFNFISTSGPYGVGTKGWTAKPLTSADGKSRYVVFSTPLTSQDRGEQLFQLANGKLDRFIPETFTASTRMTRQSIEVWFEPAAQKATFEDRITFSRTGNAPPCFFVRFSPCYQVSSVRDSAGKAVPFRQAGGIVSILAPKSAAFDLTVRYSGVVKLPQFAGSISAKEIQLTNDYWYPMIARQPCAYDLKAHVPKDWTAVGQGEEVSSTLRGNELVTTFRMDMPVTYWSFSAGPYKRHFDIIDSLGGKKLGMWSLTLDQDVMSLQSELLRPIFEFYSKLAPYPFSRWGALDTPAYGGGALEAYSFATYGTGWLPDEDTHETAHTWFGGMINNTYMNSLWNESFANYVGGLYRRECGYGNTDERRLAFIEDARPQQSFNAAPLVKSGYDIGGASAALGYGKGAIVLQMLEVEIGTEAMTECLKTWLKTQPKGKSGEWEDFEKVVLAKKPTMKWFFDQWMRRAGWADIVISNVRWTGGQVHAQANFNGRPYFLNVEVMLEYKDGKRAFKTCKIGPTPDSDAAFPTVMSAEKPVLVSFDPWRRLLRRGDGNEEPASLGSRLRTLKTHFLDASHKEWMGHIRKKETVSRLPADLNDCLLIGSPESTPGLLPLCQRAGFKVSDNKLTYKGTTIDLDSGGAMAVVDLADGGSCVIALGRSVIRPNVGRARLALFDVYGRFLRGLTEPKTSGFWTFRLD